MFCNRLGNFNQGWANFCHHPKIFYPICLCIEFYETMSKWWQWATLICKEGCKFSIGWCMRSLTAHFPVQSAMLQSQHYHYLRWLNLHVCHSVTFYISFCL
jgi:hypothetical protein